MVDGFIVAPAKETFVKQDFKHFREALKMKKPILMFDRIIQSLNCNTIESDNIKAVFNATNKLISKGKRQIAIVSCNSNLSTGQDRIEGFTRAMQMNRIHCKNFILKSDTIHLNNHLTQFLNKIKVDSIICTDEDSTYEVLKVLKGLGRKIPEDVSIIAYIDEKIAQNLTPEITTINQHRKTIGETALKMLIEQIENNELEVKKNKINSTLNIRGSF